MVLIMLTAPVMTLWGQAMNEKFSMTTQMFMNELKEQATQPATGPRRSPVRRLPDGRMMSKARRLIASPDTVGGKVYISCFIHLKDVSDLTAVSALGVEVEETFDGLDFVTARVPVNQLEQLADIENVTKIKVAQLMRPLTDKAREVTNVDDLLTQSNDAIASGVTGKYDGTGVVLGIIDTGIDFQHIAFKDKNGNSRIKRAYVYNGSSATDYDESNISSATTDSNAGDHGTHTATTAGGSSVIVNGSTVTVTDDHANATYGGMAPGADLYLAGVKGLKDTYLTNALKKMVTYADNHGKPLVVNNSWGSGWGPRDGTGEWATLVGQYFGDSHPNRIILFAASNDAGHSKDNEGGGYFVKKSSVSNSSPLGTIIRSASYSNTDAGYLYKGLIACAWSNSFLNCKIYVLDSSTGAIKTSWTVTQNNTSTFEGLDTYYDGDLTVYINPENGKYRLALYSAEGLETKKRSGSSSYYTSNYTLAIEVYPESGSANINMWSGDWSFFTDNYTTSGHTWLDGTDDMCVSDEATIPNAISVGAYVSKKSWKASNGSTYTSNEYTVGDIAGFSSYATADQSPTGLAYPWISAPGARLAAGVNHYHTTSVDDESYYGSTDLVVNNSTSPYAMMEGTSMATPVAAGIVALWLQAAKEVNQDLTVNDVKNIMEQTAINDSYTTTGANASHFGKGKIDALAGIQYILASGGPTIRTTPSSIDFGSNGYATLSYTQTFNVKGFNLEEGIAATLTDANGVYSLSQTSITQSDAAIGVDITVTYAPQAAGTHNATITLSSSNATSVEVPLTATAQAATPTIIADPETLTFTAGLSEQKSLTFDVLSEFLTDYVTVTLSDANNVFSIDKTSITKADSEDGATVTVTFNSATAGTFNGTVTLSSAGAENVVISLTGTATEAPTSDPNTTTFKLVSSVDDLVEGMRYIIACGSAGKAAGALSSQILASEDVAVNDDVITITNNVAVFVLEGNQTDGWTFKNESDNQYLYATAVKNLAYGTTAKKWTLSNGTAGVIMTYSTSTYGTMLCNTSNPRFTTYTSNPSTTMIQANLYMEYSSGTSGSSNDFALITSASEFVEGDYLIVYNNGAMKASVSSNRLQYEGVTASNDVITTDDTSIIWHIAPSGNYYTIYNADEGKYAAGTGTKNQAQLLASGTDDKSLWSVTTGSTFEFVNKYNSSKSVNANLRRNDTNGFACYSTQTGGALSLYKRTSGGTNPTLAYYANADGTKGSALKTAMCDIIYNRTEKSYDYLWTAFFSTDVRPEGDPNAGKIWDMYSNITNYTPVTSGSSYSVEGDSYNREHSWPQSWFGSDAPMYTDLHHIYPTDGFVNGKRSNYPFGETDGTGQGSYQSNGGFSKLGACTYSGYTGTVFEPADEYKGDFARTYFYMVTCYEEKLHDWYTNYSSTDVVHVIDGNKYPGFQTWQLNMLMEWAKKDPVSEKEIKRNNAVYAIQNNRNPFIDYPGLEEYIWGTMTTTAFSYNNYVQPVTVPTLAVDETSITSTSAPVSWAACNGVTEYTLQLASDDQFRANSGGGQVTLFSNDATSTTAPDGWTYNIGNTTGSYLQLTASSHYVVSEAVDASNCIGLLLSYKQRTYGGTSGNSNVVLVQYSTNNGTSWTDFGTTSASSTTLTTQTLDVSAVAGMSPVRFRLSVPDAVSSKGCGISTIVLTGTELPSSLISFATVNGTSYTFTGLTSGTTYYARVKGDDDWSNVVEFTTKNGTLDLANNGNNTSNIATAATNGGKYDVTLSNRTLWKDGGWNTLCLPFDLDAAQVTAQLENPTALMKLYGTTSNLANGTLTLNFTDDTEIRAGVPYIIKWDDGENIESPTFTGVTIDNTMHNVETSDGKVTFKGTYDYRSFGGEDKSILLLGDENTLYWPQSGASIGACRAYFQVNSTSGVRAFVLNFGEVDGISLTPSPSRGGEGSIYTLNGVKLDKMPTRKGLYIRNGVKVVIK